MAAACLAAAGMCACMHDDAALRCGPRPLPLQAHTDQEMFSCGSLMARFSSSYLVKSDGCMDHGFSRCGAGRGSRRTDT